jgi:hypothetical protein
MAPPPLRNLDVRYKTAFVLAHRSREAMVCELKGMRIGGQEKRRGGLWPIRYALETAWREHHRRVDKSPAVRA